jgi:hypothetical protein
MAVSKDHYKDGGDQHPQEPEIAAAAEVRHSDML